MHAACARHTGAVSESFRWRLVVPVKQAQRAKTRLRAIESGAIWTLRYQPGSGRFAIAPRPAPTAAEGFETADVGGELAEEPETQQLDNDILFHDPETAPVAAQPGCSSPRR